MNFVQTITNPFRNIDIDEPDWIRSFITGGMDDVRQEYTAELDDSVQVNLPPPPAWALALAERLDTDGQDWERTVETTRKQLTEAGMHPAAAASAAARVGAAAQRSSLEAGREFWEALTRTANSLQGERNDIAATSHGSAFMQGFLGQGGGQGIASLLN